MSDNGYEVGDQIDGREGIADDARGQDSGIPRRRWVSAGQVECVDFGPKRYQASSPPYHGWLLRAMGPGGQFEPSSERTRTLRGEGRSPSGCWIVTSSSICCHPSGP